MIGLEDWSDRFSRNVQATNWIEVKKKQFSLLDNKFLLVFILTCPTGLSKYGTT